jgi:hypothetical protein
MRKVNGTSGILIGSYAGLVNPNLHEYRPFKLNSECQEVLSAAMEVSGPTVSPVLFHWTQFVAF